jgi:hypothetical protein
MGASSNSSNLLRSHRIGISINLARDCDLMLSNKPSRLADLLIPKFGFGELFHIFSRSHCI